MILKTAKVFAATAAVMVTAVGCHKLGYKLGYVLGTHYYNRRGYEVTVWNGEIPAHPSQQ